MQLIKNTVRRISIRIYSRVKQPEPDIAALTLNEVNGLGLLTEAKCSSTPRLFVWKYETQGSEDWVRRCMDYVLMERMPGAMPPAYWEKDISIEE